MANVNDLSVAINGEFYNIHVGQEVRLTLHGEQQEFGNRDDVAVVTGIEDNDHPPDAEIYITRLGPTHDRWDDGVYLALWAGDFVKLFSCHESKPMVVNRDLMFKKTDLKGMKCKILATLGKRDVFIEMEKNIGGGSCDGTGRQGHCIIIKREFLTPSSKEKKTAKGKI